MSGRLDVRLVVEHDDKFRLDASLVVEPGETVALLGPNGAGKSTVVAAIAGIRPLDGGMVRLGERTLDDPAHGIFVPPEERGIGVVFQDGVLFPHLSALDNVAFGLQSSGVSKAVARGEALEWLNRVDVGAIAGSRPPELSGGQAQRVALARALVTEPGLLLLDEPLSALDAATRIQVRRVLDRHLQLFAGPRLLITHDPTEALLLADRIVVLESGSVVQIGSPDEIRRHPQTSYVADLVGVNLMRGTAQSGFVDIGPSPPIRLADTDIAGEVLVTIHPRAIALYAEPPGGSPRNAWETTIALVEPLGDRTRVQLGAPHALTVELTDVAARELHLEPGETIWVSIKATEVTAQPA